MDSMAMNFNDVNAAGDSGGRFKVYEEHATSQDCAWGTYIHVAGLVGYIVTPTLGSIVGPLILWLIKRDESPFLDDHGREAVNFHISMLIYTFIAVISCIGWPLLLILPIVQIVAPIVMAVRANHREYVRYPITIRFLS